MLMSGLAGVAAALAVAIVLTVYFRSGYRSRRDIVKHGLAATAVLALARLRGLRHAACRAGLSRHQSRQARGRIRNPPAEGSRCGGRPTPRSNCTPTEPEARPGAGRCWRPTSDGRSVLRGSVPLGLSYHRARRGAESAGPGPVPVQAAAARQAPATPISSGRGIWPTASLRRSVAKKRAPSRHDAFAIRYRVL